MIDLSQEIAVEEENKLDLSATPSKIFRPLDDEIAEQRAVKYAMALQDPEYPVNRVKDMIQTPSGEDAIRSAAAVKE